MGKLGIFLLTNWPIYICFFMSTLSGMDENEETISDILPSGFLGS